MSIPTSGLARHASLRSATFSTGTELPATSTTCSGSWPKYSREPSGREEKSVAALAVNSSRAGGPGSKPTCTSACSNVPCAPATRSVTSLASSVPALPTSATGTAQMASSSPSSRSATVSFHSRTRPSSAGGGGGRRPPPEEEGRAARAGTSHGPSTSEPEATERVGKRLPARSSSPLRTSDARTTLPLSSTNWMTKPGGAPTDTLRPCRPRFCPRLLPASAPWLLSAHLAGAPARGLRHSTASSGGPAVGLKARLQRRTSLIEDGILRPGRASPPRATTPSTVRSPATLAQPSSSPASLRKSTRKSATSAPTVPLTR
mmetsp:Transcript_2212/g.7276  ORF Transcript_2212/g.7276 Transcript_2212/m.7276 type:complete len:318 (-) Transcript_2212:335-1288(-)